MWLTWLVLYFIMFPSIAFTFAIVSNFKYLASIKFSDFPKILKQIAISCKPVFNGHIAKLDSVKLDQDKFGEF